MTAREVIKTRAGQRFEDVDVAGLGKVRIRRLSAGEMMEMPEKRGGIWLVHETAQDEEGRPLFDKLSDVENADWGVVDALIDAANRVNKINPEAELKK